MPRLRTAAFLFLLLYGLAASARAQSPAGAEFRVNTATVGYQEFGSVASAPDGSFFVVAWTDLETLEVKYQLYLRPGFPQSGQGTLSSSGYLPAVGVGAKGDFVVAWATYPGTSPDRQVRAQRFNSQGLPLDGDFQVNASTTGFHSFPRVAVDGAGGFVVAWYASGASGYQINAQRFDAGGARVGSELRVNTATVDHGSFLLDVATDRAGNFVVAWTGHEASDPSGTAAVAQLYDAAGAPVGGNFRVNTATTGNQGSPGVSYAGDGTFVVTHTSKYNYAPVHLRGRRYSGGGAALGAEFLITTGYGTGGSVAADAAGNFIVAWGDFYDGVLARRFFADGSPRGGEFVVAASVSARINRYGSIVASDAVGNFVVQWDQVTSGTALRDVYARRYGGLHPVLLEVDGPGNRVWEPGEVAEVKPLWGNSSGGPQTIVGQLTALTGPAGPHYEIVSGSADYLTIPNQAAVFCGPCYGVHVPAVARPATHWDARAVETLTPDTQGQTKIWPLHIGASFTDVPAASPFYRPIETLLHHEVTGGCTAAAFCPGAVTTRAQMAVFVLTGKEGAGYRPPACTTPVFPDVPASSPNCPFVEELVRRGVVSGCGGGLYCPDDPVTREQAAVFLLRTYYPSSYEPPACTAPPFDDVPASSPFCRWIQEAARLNITAGCGGGNYCPALSVTREQMAAFIVATFHLGLYSSVYGS